MDYTYATVACVPAAVDSIPCYDVSRLWNRPMIPRKFWYSTRSKFDGNLVGKAEILYKEICVACPFDYDPVFGKVWGEYVADIWKDKKRAISLCVRLCEMDWLRRIERLLWSAEATISDFFQVSKLAALNAYALEHGSVVDSVPSNEYYVTTKGRASLRKRFVKGAGFMLAKRPCCYVHDVALVKQSDASVIDLYNIDVKSILLSLD